MKSGYVQVPKEGRGLTRCYFREYLNDVMLEVRAERAVGFGFKDGDSYRSVRLSGDTTVSYFVKVLVAGNLNLFDDDGTLILGLPSGVGIELTAQNYKETLLTYTADCPAANEVVSLIRLSPSALESFVKSYNDCLKNDRTTYDPFEKKKPLLFGPSVGYEFSKWDVSSSSLPAFSMIDHKRFSVGAMIYFPYSKSHAVEAGIIYKPRKYVGLAQSGATVYELTVSYDEIFIPITFRQLIWKKNNVAIHGSAGAGIPILFGASSRLAIETEEYGIITTTVKSPYATVSKPVQFNLGFGAEIQFTKERRLLIHNSFMMGPGTMTASNESMNFNLIGYSLFVGFTLL